MTPTLPQDRQEVKPVDIQALLLDSFRDSLIDAFRGTEGDQVRKARLCSDHLVHGLVPMAAETIYMKKIGAAFRAWSPVTCAECAQEAVTLCDEQRGHLAFCVHRNMIDAREFEIMDAVLENVAAACSLYGDIEPITTSHSLHAEYVCQLIAAVVEAHSQAARLGEGYPTIAQAFHECRQALMAGL